MARLNVAAFAASVTRAAALASLIVTFSKRIPKQLKWFFVFLITLNIHNFPLVWHFRILTPWFWAIWKTNFQRRIDGPKGHLKHLTNTSTIGKSPFDRDVVQVHRATAEIPDCDYNGHLSNSSYAKNLDQARMNACIQYFPGFSRTGGIMLLGGGYFQFLKEIPLHKTFEIRFHISGWDDKWIYLTGAFISLPKTHKRRHHDRDGGALSKSEKHLNGAGRALPPAIKDAAKEAAGTISESLVIVPPVAEGGGSETNSAIPSGVVSPAEPSSTDSSSPNGATTPSQVPITYDNIRPVPIPEGATLHAMSISQYCYKHGGVTVPPRVALILSGFGTPEKAKERWHKLLAIRDDKRKVRDLLRGGWKSEDGGGLGAGFWDFEYEEEGQRRGQEIRRVRDVMDTLTGK